MTRFVFGSAWVSRDFPNRSQATVEGAALDVGRSGYADTRAVAQFSDFIHHVEAITKKHVGIQDGMG
jgi:hypothetical protein